MVLPDIILILVAIGYLGLGKTFCRVSTNQGPILALVWPNE